MELLLVAGLAILIVSFVWSIRALIIAALVFVGALILSLGGLALEQVIPELGWIVGISSAVMGAWKMAKRYGDQTPPASESTGGLSMVRVLVAVFGITFLGAFFAANDSHSESGSSKPDTALPIRRAVPVTYTFRAEFPTDELQVHTGAGEHFSIIGALPNGTRGITPLGKPVSNGNTEWVQIRLGEAAGWVAKRYLQPE